MHTQFPGDTGTAGCILVPEGNWHKVFEWQDAIPNEMTHWISYNDSRGKGC